MGIVRSSRSVDWTKERIAALTTPDVRQLRANAERLNAPDVMELCDAVLGERPRGGGASAKSRSGASATSRSSARRPGEKKNSKTGGAT